MLVQIARAREKGTVVESCRTDTGQRGESVVVAEGVLLGVDVDGCGDLITGVSRWGCGRGEVKGELRRLAVGGGERCRVVYPYQEARRSPGEVWLRLIGVGECVGRVRARQVVRGEE